MFFSPDLRRAVPLLGTIVEISVVQSDVTLSSQNLNDTIDAAFGEIALIDRLMSVHNPSSDLSKINLFGFSESVTVHPYTCEVLRCAEELHLKTQGVFNITRGAMLLREGFIRNPLIDSNTEFSSNTSASCPVVLGESGRVTLKERVIIDLGGIAKGFAVDKGVETLKRLGIKSGVVNAGGDIRCFGVESHRVLLRDPASPTHYLDSIYLCEEAFASSSPLISGGGSEDVSYESSLMDGRSGEFVKAPIGISIRAPSCMIADALTKVAFHEWGGLVELLKHYRAQAFRIENGVIEVLDP